MKFVLFLFTFYSFLRADTVILKSGKTLENVKSFMKKKSVVVNFENGSVKEYPKKEIKQVKFALVTWTNNIPANLKQTEKEKYLEELRKEEEKRMEKISDLGEDWIPRPDEEQIDPTTTAGLSLLPFYSGLFRTKNYLGGGIFVFLKMGTAVASASAKTREGVMPFTIFLFFTWLDAYNAKKEAEKWNEGVYLNPREKKTHPLSRLWRSTIFPGLGQTYAGHDVKGPMFSFFAFIGLGVYYGQSENLRLLNDSYEQNRNSSLFVSLFLSSSEIDLPGLTQLNFIELQLQQNKINRTKQNLALIQSTLLVFYVYNLFDAYFGSGIDVEEETGLKFYPDIRMQFAHNVPQPTLEAYYGGMLQWKW